MYTAVLFREKPRLFYKIKRKMYQSDFLLLDCIFASRPKNDRQKRKLQKALGERFGKTLFSDEEYAAKNFPEYIYNTKNFRKRLLAEAFLRYCKEKQPKSISVFDDGFLKAEYYKKLSRYTDNMFLPNITQEDTLAEEILKTSGIVIWRKNLANEFCATLNITDEQETSTIQTVLFDQGFLKTKTEKAAMLLPKELNSLEPFSALGLMFYEFNEKKLYEKCVKKVAEL